MLDTKITRILMNMATCEEGIAKSHEAKAKLLRELAAEIEFPDQPSRTENPKPTPKPNTKIEVKTDSWDEAENELGEVVFEWLKRVDRIKRDETLKRLRDITPHPTSWPF